MHILIADDDRLSSMVLATILGGLGHEVVEASDGDRAWDLLCREHFPVLISDWLMPGIDGLELCRRVRAEKGSHYTYIIMLTVRDGKASYLAGIEAGADDFMVKPVDEDQLAARLHVARRILSLQEENLALAELIPVCSFCGKARNDCAYWERLEEYLAARGARFSHGICDECFRTRYPELWARKLARRGEAG